MSVENDDEKPRPAQPLRSNPAAVRRSEASRDPFAELEARFLPEVLPTDRRELAQLRREFDTKVGAYHKVLADWDKALDGGDLVVDLGAAAGGAAGSDTIRLTGVSQLTETAFVF